MHVSLVLTLIGPDRPGLVEALARTVAAHDASWVESRMASLAGHFAGLLHVRVPESNTEALTDDLSKLGASGLRVVVETSHGEPVDDPSRAFRLELLGTDRPGIVRDIARAFAERGINVEELTSECEAAPMSGGLLFRASAEFRLPPGVRAEALRSDLEKLANDLMVDIEFHEPSPASKS